VVVVFVATVVVSVLLAAAMVATFSRKVRRDRQSEQLRAGLGVGERLWQLVGLLELAAAAGLLVGLAVGPLGVAAAVGVALVMVGALAFHLRARIAGAALTPPLAVLAVACAAAALRLATL
jgi:DoxX-like family